MVTVTCDSRALDGYSVEWLFRRPVQRLAAMLSSATGRFSRWSGRHTARSSPLPRERRGCPTSYGRCWCRSARCISRSGSGDSIMPAGGLLISLGYVLIEFAIGMRINTLAWGGGLPA